MARDFQRSQRLSQQVLRELAQLLREEVRDPRVGFVTLTDVEVSRDISHAKVYFSLLDPAADLEATSQALRRAAGFLRSRLGERITARTVPQLEFVYDSTSENASRMDALLRGLHPAQAPTSTDDGATPAAIDDGAAPPAPSNEQNER